MSLYYLCFYPGTSEFNVGTGPGMPGCSYATALHAVNGALSLSSTPSSLPSLPFTPSPLPFLHILLLNVVPIVPTTWMCPLLYISTPYSSTNHTPHKQPAPTEPFKIPNIHQPKRMLTQASLSRRKSVDFRVTDGLPEDTDQYVIKHDHTGSFEILTSPSPNTKEHLSIVDEDLTAAMTAVSLRTLTHLKAQGVNSIGQNACHQAKVSS